MFVLEWTPALTQSSPSQTTLRKLLGADENEGHRGTIPHGHIFAGFMVSGLGICSGHVVGVRDDEPRARFNPQSQHRVHGDVPLGLALFLV